MTATITPLTHPENIHSYSVQEDVTSFDPSSMSGGYGQLTFTVDDYDESPRLLGTTLTLQDGSRGKFQGLVRALDGSSVGTLNVTADSPLALFNSWHSVPPFEGFLGDYVTDLATRVGITLPVITDGSTPYLVAPGFLGNVWDNLKQCLTANQCEIALVYNNVVVRESRRTTAFAENVISENYSINDQTTAETVEIVWRKNTSIQAQHAVYPGELETTPLSVEANATITQSFNLNASLILVNQPVAIDFVNDDPYEGTNGVYSVVGKDDLPITAAQWTAGGGSVSVRLTEDPSVIEVTVNGANIPDLSPFRLAMSSGSSTYYDSLRITGTGFTWTEETLTLPTGAPPNATGQTVGVTVTNPHINSLAKAYTSGFYAAATFSGGRKTITGYTPSLNRPGTTEEFISATMEDFNNANTTSTMADFNAAYSGQTMEDFNTYWSNVAEMRFDNQLFGQGVGSRFFRSNATYRVVSTVTGLSDVQYTAVLDTTMSDFNSENSGRTMGDFNTEFAGYRMRDFNLAPMKRTF